MKVAIIGYFHDGTAFKTTGTMTVSSKVVSENVTYTYECKGNSYNYDYEPISINRQIELYEQKFIRHRANRVKKSKIKTKQKAGTKFMWHKQN
ncbi:hypothetical protein CCP3SC1AL1_1620010 [Gammaproteobacteria bacterium]